MGTTLGQPMLRTAERLDRDRWHAHDNEARSADWAAELLTAGGADAARIARVEALVMATVHAAALETPARRNLQHAIATLR